MPLRFLLDEHLRGPLAKAIERHNHQGGLPIDIVRVGDATDLPLGSPDPAILLWIEREGRILISEDKRTLPSHLVQHLLTGHHSPGILILMVGCTISQIVSYLELVAHAGNSLDYQDAITYIS